MKTMYFVAVRVLGGNWVLVRDTSGGPAEFSRLEDAMGMAATLRSPIKEALVGSVVTSFIQTSEGLCIAKEYRNIEYLPPL